MGSQGHNTVICAMKKFESFCRDTDGTIDTDIIHKSRKYICQNESIQHYNNKPTLNTIKKYSNNLFEQANILNEALKYFENNKPEFNDISCNLQNILIQLKVNLNILDALSTNSVEYNFPDSDNPLDWI